VVEIGPNLAAVLLGLVPVLVAIGTALAIYIRARADAIHATVQDTNQAVKRIESKVDSATPEQKERR
jgi:outer membrane murein-binding lipoprotein Lpp